MCSFGRAVAGNNPGTMFPTLTPLTTPDPVPRTIRFLGRTQKPKEQNYISSHPNVMILELTKGS